MKKIIPLLLLVPLLSSCGAAGRLQNVGKAPRFSAPEPVAVVAVEPSLARPVAGGVAVPLAPPAAAPSASLFRAGAGDLFRDQRAARVGDVLTIRINVADRAIVDNATSRERSGSENAGLAQLLGLNTLLQRVLPGEPDTGNLVEANSRSRSGGSGNTARSETINMTVAAVVTDVLPNGNFLIRGRQEMRVNFELRELVVTGMIRPQDIGRDNSIQHSQIAEARIAYGGRGQITDAQQARWGQQIYDALFPF